MADTTATTKKQKGHFRRNWSFYFLMLGLLAVSGYVWFTKSYEIQEQKSSFEDKVIALETTAKTTLKSTTERDMTSVAKAFALAVAGRAMFSDWEDIDAYFRELVKADNILAITLIEDDGMVLVSTNKKLEEDYWKESNLTTIQETEQVLFLKDDDGKDIVVAPVMNKENRYGTLVIAFKVDELKY